MARRKRRREPPAPTSRAAWDEIHPTIDLHGETAEAARRRAERWLRDRQKDGIQVVRVITGRGTHSVGPPVLRGEIENLLGTLRGTLVSRFTVEAGGGAFRVELHRGTHPELARATSGSGAAVPSLRGIDPELRRRAEEALWELGIEPTPVLVRAEVQRLQRERETP